MMRSLALVALAGIAACAAPQRRADLFVVPTGDGALCRFSAQGVTIVSEDGARLRQYANRGGMPRAVALELESGLAVVAHERALAVNEMRGANEPAWVSLTPPFATTAMALREDRCALLDRKGAVRIVRLPTGDVQWQGAASLRVDATMLVVPTTPNEHVALARRGETLLVQRVSRSRGAPEMAGETTIPNMNVFGAAATAGGALFVAGLREETTASMRATSTQQWLVVSRVDLDTFRVTEIAYERCPALDTRVQDITVGQDMIALAVWMYERGTRLRAYDQVAGRRPASWSFDQQIEPGSAIAWVAGDSVAATLAETPARVFQVTAPK